MERLAPDSEVKEIDNFLRHLLHFINSVGTKEIVMLIKIDVSDGFWSILVEEDARCIFIRYAQPTT